MQYCTFENISKAAITAGEKVKQDNMRNLLRLIMMGADFDVFPNASSDDAN